MENRFDRRKNVRLPFRRLSIEKIMTKDLLIKFLNNTCSEEELNIVLEWVNSESFRSDEIKGWILEDWNSFSQPEDQEDDSRLRSLFDKIQEKIDAGEQKVKQNSIKPIRFDGFLQWLTKAAAVLLVPVLTFLFYTLHENKVESARYSALATDSLEVIAPIGSRTVVHLSDGSIVHLNYGSKLKYPRFFSGTTREVALTGEGFFQVSHNPKQPFIVKAGKLDVEAVGTTFNVLAYPEDNVIETTLVNGKVLLTTQDNDGKTTIIGAMIPGQHVEYQIKTGAVSSSSGDVEKYIGWTEGKLIFVDTPITQIAEKLNRMFNVDIEIQDNVKDLYYTFTLVDEPLFQILDAMTIATPEMSYRIIPRKSMPDRSFSKQIIIINKK